ncbi:hypothetical protein ARC77_28450 [Escherichia coli]|nr:hypothetical protein ARC77_28450 [Escherichia coli]
MRWWKKLDFVANDNHYHFCGSSWWGGPEHGAGGAEKGAFFVIYRHHHHDGNLFVFNAVSIKKMMIVVVFLFDIFIWRHFFTKKQSHFCSAVYVEGCKWTAS